MDNLDPAIVADTADTADTSGFYKRDSDVLLYAPNFVLNAAYELRRETREQHAYPVDGWAWFDSVEAAYASHGLPLPAAAEPLPDPTALFGLSPAWQLQSIRKIK